MSNYLGLVEAEWVVDYPSLVDTFRVIAVERGFRDPVIFFRAIAVERGFRDPAVFGHRAAGGGLALLVYDTADAAAPKR